jgi:hypothetical protein
MIAFVLNLIEISLQSTNLKSPKSASILLLKFIFDNINDWENQIL